MPVRTTAQLVAGIIEVDSNIDLTPFIETASELVTEVCAIASYSVTRLELIERWLSAHFYAIRDPRTTQEKAGSVGENFESKVDLNLALTRYGQQAMMLDTAGGLLALSSAAPARSRTPSVVWLGTSQTE
jgi:hypothetical protein